MLESKAVLKAVLVLVTVARQAVRRLRQVVVRNLTNRLEKKTEKGTLPSGRDNCMAVVPNLEDNSLSSKLR